MIISLTKDPVTMKGIFGSILMGSSDLIFHVIGPMIGVLSGILGLFLVVLSIIQKRREMRAWEKANKK